MKRYFLPIACLLPLASCAQLTSFEQRAAPVVAQACAAFHKAEANPLVQVALAGGATAATLASGVPVGAIVSEIRSYGRAFCENGPPAGDSTTPEQRAAWLAGVTAKLLGSAGALR